jgi:hypothetical protein
MDDDQIRAAMNEASPDPRMFMEIVRMGGVEPTGDIASDVRMLALAYELEPEAVIYGLLGEDSPFYKEEQ